MEGDNHALMAIAVMAVTGGIATTLGMWLALIGKKYVDQVLTGHIDGVPITKEHRRLIVSYNWPMLVGIAISVLAVNAVGFWQIGIHCPTYALEALCKASAWAYGVLAVGWLISGFRNSRSLNRFLDSVQDSP